jgi:hypothetical protein
MPLLSSRDLTLFSWRGLSSPLSPNRPNKPSQLQLLESSVLLYVEVREESVELGVPVWAVLLYVEVREESVELGIPVWADTGAITGKVIRLRATMLLPIILDRY